MAWEENSHICLHMQSLFYPELGYLYIKIGLWILTELTEFSTRRLSWMKRERGIIKSWIHFSTRILSLRHIGSWRIDGTRHKVG